ncbi:MAG TPA: phosphoglycerate dehydrogenase [Candidatus Dormibacteraeota bacterium]|nr:phosphoglycerate dehydrogenase [Candidatus Dormibacteraeota bacterium]
MKVIVADKISERGVQLLKQQPGWNVVLTTKDTLYAEITDAEALIVRSATKVTPELLDKATKLRCVGRAGVGVDNIDLEAATKRGVLVMSTPGGNAVSVAEHTFALLLSLARQVPQLDKAIHEGRWEKSSAAGTEVRGKTLGLIGLGRIGSEVAMRAEAFDMRVLGYDPYISEAAAREVSVELVPLEKLLAESDFVSLHTALSPATQNLINAASIAQMKKGARIINAARGELIDEAALADALKSGHLAGAALDVFAVEPPKNSPLIGLSTVIGTPHVAGSTTEAQEEVGTQVAVQVRDYLADGIIRNAVNLPALSAEQYRRVRPYLELANRLGSLVSQAAASRPARIRIRYAGEVAEVGTHLLRSAVLAGVLNAVLDEKVNVVNAPAIAAARGLIVEEETRRREHGFPNTLEVAALPEKTGSATAFTAEGTVLYDGSPRLLQIEGIALEAQLEGTILYLRNRDEPGVIGQVGSTLGKLGVNIATFALGRREATRGAEAVSLVRLDGEVSTAILDPIRAIPAITEAKLLRLAGA